MLNHEDLLLRLYEILGPLTKEGRTLAPDTQLVADLGLDSMQVMELLSNIEDEFDISVPLNIVPDVRTVNDLADQISKLVVSS
ncbi:MAG: acyl carrier protein [Nitrospirales bacterium]